MQMPISTCHPHPARSGLTNGCFVTSVWQQRCASDTLKQMSLLSHALEQGTAKCIITTYVNLTVNGDVCFALCLVHHPASIGVFFSTDLFASANDCPVRHPYLGLPGHLLAHARPGAGKRLGTMNLMALASANRLKSADTKRSDEKFIVSTVCCPLSLQTNEGPPNEEE